MRTDEDFRILVGCVLTVYAVRVRRVEGVNARSFKAAKEAIVSFAATTTPWAVRSPAGDRRWRRGPLHEDEAVQGREHTRAVERVGGLSDRFRGKQSRFCPSCGAENPRATFRTRLGIRCPACAGAAKAASSVALQPQSDVLGRDGPQGHPEALEATME